MNIVYFITKKGGATCSMFESYMLSTVAWNHLIPLHTGMQGQFSGLIWALFKPTGVCLLIPSNGVDVTFIGGWEKSIFQVFTFSKNKASLLKLHHTKIDSINNIKQGLLYMYTHYRNIQKPNRPWYFIFTRCNNENNFDAVWISPHINVVKKKIITIKLLTSVKYLCYCISKAHYSNLRNIGFFKMKYYSSLSIACSTIFSRSQICCALWHCCFFRDLG